MPSPFTFLLSMSAFLLYRLSSCQLFRLQPPSLWSGMHCPTTSSQHHPSTHSSISWRLLCSSDLSVVSAFVESFMRKCFCMQWQTTAVAYKQIARNQSLGLVCENCFAEWRWSCLAKVTFESQKNFLKKTLSHGKVGFWKWIWKPLSKENFPVWHGP